MARLLSDIIQAIRTVRQAKPGLAGLDAPDPSADFALWEDVIGYSHLQIEIKNDDLKAEILQEIADNAPGGISWWHKKILEFQFDPTTPQVVEEIDFIVQYPVIDETLRIITRCAVRNVLKNNRLIVSVKVAKTVNDALVPLNDTELSALTDYTLAIRPAGISMEEISLFADRLKVTADVYYYGQYVKDVVFANVIQAINDYCESLSVKYLDGVVKLSLLEDFIQAVDGVSDVVLHQVIGREQATPIDGSNVVIIDRLYNTSAGYIIPEDTIGHTLSDTITLIAESN